tara:strand:- start:97 stop:1083 length:987 start_codon:yes stop_codon:yes gene_type:complete
MKNNLKIFITGGAGYVGTSLTEKLLELGYSVTVYDLFLYGNFFTDNPKLNLIKGDIRNEKLIEASMINHDIVIHLACISNDPSFELNPSLGKSINFDSFEPLVQISKKNKIKRFIYASSSSVYGIKKEKNVTEDIYLEPLTDYSKYKAECEKILSKYSSKDFTTVTLRPATVCGYSKRQRLDVVVNILTNHAYFNKKIIVFGGNQLRPNINIKDMVEAYICLINAPDTLINNEVFNAGYENNTVSELGLMVKNIIGNDVVIETKQSDDNRSYHINSSKIEKKLNFKPKYSINESIETLLFAFENKLLENTFDKSTYYNIKLMKEIDLA